MPARYHTGWPTTPVSVVDAGTPQATIVVGRRNSIRYSDYSSVDVRLSRDFELPRGDLSVFAEITNAFDRRNPCCTDHSYAYPDGQLRSSASTGTGCRLCPRAGCSGDS